ncbi:MAG: hypothetical protein QNJ01_13990 [Desulfobacterales bacterium]|nr:hypothetical protein [Desulfobacterales bacterium]
MKAITYLFTLVFLLALGTFLAPDSEARNNTCKIKAIKDVNLQAHSSAGGRKAPNIRSKRDVIWSGNLHRGNSTTVTTRNGWVHLAYQDLTKQDPRSENDDKICQNGNVILVPR